MFEAEHLMEKKRDGRIAEHENENRDDLFAQMLEEYQPAPLRQGQYVKGEILHIGENVILVDVAAKRTAVVPAQDLGRIEEEDLAQLSVGDPVTLYVIHTPEGDDDLLVSLNKGLAQQDWERAKTIMEADEMVELEVVGHNKGGLVVSFGYLRGFVPASHVPNLWHHRNQSRMAAQKAEMVGETLALKVIEAEPARRRLVLSAKRAQKELRQKRLLELQLQQGQTITGIINNLVDFGAFVDLDGVEGLIHISEIDWEKVTRASDYLTPGEEVEVLIQSVDVERERVSLSRKALLPSPWQAFADSHAPDDLMEGEVISVVDFGAFVRLADGIEGLVHISEMRGAREFAAEDVLRPGDRILVRILSIQPEQERLALSQKRITQAEETEWIWQQQVDQATEMWIDEEE